MTLADRTVLDNGAVLVSQAVPSNPFIAFRGSLPAGTAQEAPDEFGVAEFTARLLLSGTKRASAARLADRLEGIGAALEFLNAEETLGFHGRCTRDTVAETMRILVECFATPAFPPKEVERVRASILNDLRQEADDTHDRANLELARILFPKDHPYGRNPKASPARVRTIRRRDVVTFHEGHVGPDGLILAVAGDVDPAVIEEAIARPLGRLRAEGASSGDIPPPPVYRPRTGRIPMPHKSQADIAVGGPAVARRHDDYYALHVANLVFGRIGLGGRLGQRIRDDQGLAYYAFSSLDARLAGGHWSVSAGVNPKNLVKAVQAIRVEAERLEKEPFTEQEIRDGKTHLVGALQVNLERNAEYAGALHDVEYHALGTDFLARYPALVRAVDPDSVRKKAVACFDPTACSWVVSGPVAGLKLAF